MKYLTLIVTLFAVNVAQAQDDRELLVADGTRVEFLSDFVIGTNSSYSSYSKHMVARTGFALPSHSYFGECFISSKVSARSTLIIPAGTKFTVRWRSASMEWIGESDSIRVRCEWSSTYALPFVRQITYFKNDLTAYDLESYMPVKVDRSTTKYQEIQLETVN